MVASTTPSTKYLFLKKYLSTYKNNPQTTSAILHPTDYTKIFRNSRPEEFLKKSVQGSLAKFTEKYLRWSF